MHNPAMTIWTDPHAWQWLGKAFAANFVREGLYYLLAALPYALTLALLIGLGKPGPSHGAPGELSLNR